MTFPLFTPPVHERTHLLRLSVFRIDSALLRLRRDETGSLVALFRQLLGWEGNSTSLTPDEATFQADVSAALTFLLSQKAFTSVQT